MDRDGDDNIRKGSSFSVLLSLSTLSHHSPSYRSTPLHQYQCQENKWEETWTGRALILAFFCYLSLFPDKTVLVWNLARDDDGNYGVARKSLRGHNSAVQDVVISSDGQFALSASWDKTLRLWDLNTGKTTRRFVGHTNDVLSVSFSADNRQIVSGSRDKSIKLWNTLGECKYTIQQEDGHTEWVSCVRFSPNPANPVIVSGGWDKVVKVKKHLNCSSGDLTLE